MGWGRGLLVVGLVVSASCGARWTDDQQAAVEARGAASTSAGAGAGRGSANGAGAGIGGPAVAGGGVGGAGGDVVGAGGSSIGGAGAGAGPTDVAHRSTDAPQPCAAPSDAPGVTDAEIGLGAINSLSGPVPGLGSSALAATRAYIEYRNATGGVCGRQLVLRSADDGGDLARNRALVRELDPQVLGFVGGIAGGDDGGAEIVQAERIPFIGNSISPELRSNTPTYFGVNMPLASYDRVLGKFRFLQEHGVTRAAVVYSSPAISEGQDQLALIRAAGIDVVLDLALPITTLSYDSAARAVANSGAEYMIFIHEAGASAAMARALADADYTVRFPEYIVAYGSNFAELAGAAAEGAMTWLYTLPNEDAGTNAELDAFLTWMRQSAPDAAVDTFASVAWVAAKAFVDVLEAIPGPITREAIIDQASTTGTYDAGGFLAPVQLSAKHSDGCLVGVAYHDGSWRRLVPDEGFLC